MTVTSAFIINSILLGAGLAMDAFSVSIANGLEDGMSHKRMCCIAGTYAGFQFLMPLAGWFCVHKIASAFEAFQQFCVHKIASAFEAFQQFIPWIALFLLSYIGGKMLADGIWKIRAAEEEKFCCKRLDPATLFMQGIATSIDALSVGFTISAPEALTACAIVAVVTFAICMCGLRFGRHFGARLSDKASILGGTILIGIGLEIFIRSFLP